METLNEAPKPSSFIPLVEHQSTTPASFYEGPPVLHYYSDRCKLVVLNSELPPGSPIKALASKAKTSTSNGTATNSSADDVERTETIENVDIWVTSQKFFLFSDALESGFSIPYPSISLHAIQTLPNPEAADTISQGVYMQVLAAPPNPHSEQEPESMSLTIVPTASAPPILDSAAAEDHADAPLQTEDQKEQSPVQALFTALSNCSNLHPDPADEDEDGPGMQIGDGIEESRLFQAGLLQPGGGGADGLPPPMPGSGGWITAENMHEYFDEEGNWIGPDDSLLAGEHDEANGDADEIDDQQVGELGPGAGSVRARDDGAANGSTGEGEETKWRRTG